MAKNLIIVESPAKTRTLKKFLGRDWAVEASLGHIRDLPKKDMGLGPGFEPHYAILAAKKKVVENLREKAKKAEVIYLAPDPDREGEAIAWHIAQVLATKGKHGPRLLRVTFNEITKKAVTKALANPGEIDHCKVDAQQARRVLDRLMGFKLSPLLWDKVKRGLSAGRVQSVALKMVCERQAEIDAFQPVEYWLLGAELAASRPPTFFARLHSIDGKKAEVANGEQSAKIAQALEAGSFRVAAVERKESKQRPAPPFITSRLQQEAARRYGFSVKRTMALAQGLYEGREIGDRGAIGLITYMRTDSTRVADEAIAAVRETIVALYGRETLPEKPNVYTSKKGAQDAHEAIRPTYLDLPPEAVAGSVTADELKLYRLIWDRFVASQMLPAIFDVTQVDVESGPYVLRATGKVLKSPGFLAVYRETAEEESANGDAEGANLPPLETGESLRLVRLAQEQKFTQPPAQFSEATLVKALEENGIGRPSTYASILSTLTDREYVDKIEEGEMPWKQAITEFDEKFTRDLATADREMPNVKRDGLPTGESCPKCGGALVQRFGRYGAFIGCSNYQNDPPCDYTRDLAPAAGSDIAIEDQPPCEKCGKPMALRRSRFGVFLGCTGYPECKNIRKLGPKAEPPKETGVGCPECGEGTILEKKSRRGKVFYSCSRYPACKFALWDRPVAQACPKCGAPFLVEKVSKKKGTRLLCRREGCGFEETLAEAEVEAS